MIPDFFKAILSYRHTFRLIFKLKLWRFFGIPIGISILMASLILGLAWNFGPSIGRLISNLWIWEWRIGFSESLQNIFGRILLIVIGIIIYRRLVMALSAPFMGPVSEKIEKHLYPQLIVREQSGFFPMLIRGFRINIRNFFVELAFTIPVLILGMIPFFGFISAFLLLFIQAYYAGFGTMDYTLERHFSYRESLRFVRKNRGTAIGNGLFFTGILMIPFVGVILVFPLSVTAATKSTLEKIKKTDKEFSIENS